MSDLIRTNSGYMNASAFYRDQMLVYVEGQDDRLFWGVLFPREWKGARIHFKISGGSAINKVLPLIRSGIKDAVAAIDSDYSGWLGIAETCDRVIVTHRYSIENYLFVPEIVDEMIRHKCRLANPLPIAEKWAVDLEALKELALLDCLVRVLEVGGDGLGNSAQRYTRKSGWRLHATKIKAVCRRLRCAKPQLSAFLPCVRCLLSRKPLYHYLRGHFLADAARNLIQHHRKRLCKSKRGLNQSDLFDEALSIWSRHPEGLGRHGLERQIAAALNSCR